METPVSNAPAANGSAGWQQYFDSEAALASWQQLEIPGWASKWRLLKIHDGQLVLEPKSSGWFEDNYGGLLSRELTGDFIVTTRLKVEGTADALPQTAFSLAGLLVRKPREFRAETWRPGQENWLFFSTGAATEPGTPQFEIKTTYQSTSTLKIFPAQAGWMELRIVRQEEIFSLFYRYDGQPWQLLDQFIRPDLPATLQVGLTAYADWPSVAEVYPDYLRYNRHGTPTDHADLRATFAWLAYRKPLVDKPLPLATLRPEQWQDFTS
ncbi:MAG: hypothetical protein H7Z21_06810 [Hymenobacter sp.]|nr:hypothetical protein [Hymenobacter sp.]